MRFIKQAALIAIPQESQDRTKEFLLQLRQKLMADVVAELSPSLLYTFIIEERTALGLEFDKQRIPYKSTDNLHFVAIKVAIP